MCALEQAPPRDMLAFGSARAGAGTRSKRSPALKSKWAREGLSWARLPFSRRSQQGIVATAGDHNGSRGWQQQQQQQGIVATAGLFVGCSGGAVSEVEAIGTGCRDWLAVQGLAH